MGIGCRVRWEAGGWGPFTLGKRKCSGKNNFFSFFQLTPCINEAHCLIISGSRDIYVLVPDGRRVENCL